MSDQAHEPLVLNCKRLQREIERDPFLPRAVKDDYIRRLDECARQANESLEQPPAFNAGTGRVVRIQKAT